LYPNGLVESEMSDTEKLVLRALETYKSAVLSKNVDTLMHLYDPDVRVFDAWGIWSYEGAVAWRVAIEGWFSSLQNDKCRVTFEDVRIISDSDFAAMSAIATYTGMTEQCQDIRAMQNRISWILKTSGHVLRIVHEHTSVPVGYEDAKAILNRDSKS
jgi:ketosteroid isomerase-like protein